MTVVKEGREEDQAEDAAVGQADQVQSVEVQKQVNRYKVNPGVPLRFWLKQGKEKRRPARKTDYRQGFNKST